MDLSTDLNNIYSRESSEEKLASSQENEEEKGTQELLRNIRDLELQLEYEINQHNLELAERDNKIKKLEGRIIELENEKEELMKEDHNERDSAVQQMSQKLLDISEEYNNLLKDVKLKEEEIKHLKNKKKYRNDKTNEYITTLKKQNEEFKSENDNLKEKYSQSMKELEELKKQYKKLKEDITNENKQVIENLKNEKKYEDDENNALRILNLKHELKKVHHKKDELSTLKMELEYKNMIIQKLIKSKIAETRIVKYERNHEKDRVNNEKKIDELYNKYLDAQSDNDKLRKQLGIYKSDIKHLREENEMLINNLNTLRDLRSKSSKDNKQINQFDDLLNLILKENSDLATELSNQRRKNIKDTDYFNKEIKMIENDKMKIIEKFDHQKVRNIPHLYEPLSITLDVKDEKSNESEENIHLRNIYDFYSTDSDMNNLKQKHNMPIITDDLVHIYIHDYMDKVLNKR